MRRLKIRRLLLKTLKPKATSMPKMIRRRTYLRQTAKLPMLKTARKLWLARLKMIKPTPARKLPKPMIRGEPAPMVTTTWERKRRMSSE